MMSDGTELGMLKDASLGWLADESPSNGGAIIEFSPSSPAPSSGLPWPSGNSAYMRGASYENGILVEQYLYTFQSGAIVHVGWTADVSKATKFLAINIPGNRISVRAVRPSSLGGMRLNKVGKHLEVDQSTSVLPLACQFVRVQSIAFITPLL